MSTTNYLSPQIERTVTLNFTEYTEKRNAIIEKLTAAASAGDDEQFRNLQQEIDGIDAEYDKANKVEERNAYIEGLRNKAKKPAAGIAPPDGATHGRKPAQVDEDPRATVEYRNAFLDFIKTGDKRSVSMVSGPDGAYALAPAAIDSMIFTPTPKSSGITSRVRTINLNGTLGVNGLSVTARNAQFFKGTQATIGTTTEASLTFAQRKLSSWPFTAILPVDNAVLQNGVMGDMLSFLAGQFQELIDEQKEGYIWYGTGDAEPLGVLVDDAQGISSTKHIEKGGSGGLITFHQLVAMQYGVKARYRAGAEWYFCTDAMIQIEALRDDNDQPILKERLTSDGPVTTLFGRPIYESEKITPTANATTGLFADNTLVGAFLNPMAYTVAQPTIAAFRTSDQRLFEKDQTLVKVLFWMDGGPATEDAVSVCKIVN